MTNKLLRMETLIGLEFAPADTHIPPATSNFLTRSNHRFSKRSQNIDILTGMPTEPSVCPSEYANTEINLLTGEVERKRTSGTNGTAKKQMFKAAKHEDEDAENENVDKDGVLVAEEVGDSLDSFQLPSQDSHDPSEALSCTITRDAKVSPDQSKKNGDYTKNPRLGMESTRINRATEASNDIGEADLISFDKEATATRLQSLPNRLPTSSIIINDTSCPHNISTSIFTTIPAPAVTSGPSFIRPNEIKSAYGLNRERELIASQQANEEAVVKALEFFRAKHRREDQEAGLH